MYNQLVLQDEALPYSLILYSPDSSPDPDTYVLVSAWYGVVSTGGQAGEALDRLALEEADNYPNAVASLGRERYVDDIASGANTPEERELQISEVGEVLKIGGFALKYIVRS